jgi:hypothetical protein
MGMFLDILLSIFLRVVSAMGLVALALTVILDAISTACLGMISLNTLTAMQPMMEYVTMVRRCPPDKEKLDVQMASMCENLHSHSPQLLGLFIASLSFTTTAVVQQFTKTVISGCYSFMDAFNLKALRASCCLRQ